MMGPRRPPRGCATAPRGYVPCAMAAPVTTASVWKELERQSFAVLGEVNRRGEARTCGILYKSYGRKLYIATAKDAWKVRHAIHNHNVSMTVCIPKRLPFMPFIQIPAATITFAARTV